MTFKRGATPGTMATDEDACRSTNSDEAAFAECLRQRGWLVTGAGTTAAPESTAGRAPDEASAPAVATTPSAPNAAAPTGAAQPQALDPMTRIEVASWWKLGGTASDLDRAIDGCVGELGTAHRPDSGATVVTAGLRACLQAAGWRTLGASGPQ
jgi:hypothetical protein